MGETRHSMCSQLRARIKVRAPSGCPLTSLEVDTDHVQLLSRTIDHAGKRIDLLASKRDIPTEHDAISSEFTDGATTIYRVETDTNDCICRTVECSGIPIECVDIDEDGLYYTVYPSSRDELRTVLARLRKCAESVQLVQLTADTTVGEETSYNTIDMNRLTERQREVLRTAHRMGYFSYPRETTAEEIADALDIATSTVHKHLVAALGNLFDSLYPVDT